MFDTLLSNLYQIFYTDGQHYTYGSSSFFSYRGRHDKTILSYNVASGNDITSCIKIDKPLKV